MQLGSERAVFKAPSCQDLTLDCIYEEIIFNAVLEMQPFPFHPLGIHPPNVIINLQHPRVTNKLLGAEVTN